MKTKEETRRIFRLTGWIILGIIVLIIQGWILFEIL